MYPILIEIGKIKIYTYGVIVAIAFLIASEVSVRLSKYRKNISSQKILDASIWLIIGGVVGARLFYILMNIKEYMKEPGRIFKIWEGGLAWYGAVLFGILFLYVWAKRNRERILNFLDSVTTGAALGLMIGRWGCFSAGCCYGKPTDLPWGVVFKNPASLAIVGVHIHPTQVYESLGAMLIFAFLLGFTTKKVFHSLDIFAVLEYILFRFYFLWFGAGKKFGLFDFWLLPSFFAVFYLFKFMGTTIKIDFEGFMSSLWVLFYSSLRFSLEFLRNPEGLTGWIIENKVDLNHITSTILFILSISYITWGVLKRKTLKNKENK